MILEWNEVRGLGRSHFPTVTIGARGANLHRVTEIS